MGFWESRIRQMHLRWAMSDFSVKFRYILARLVNFIISLRRFICDFLIFEASSTLYCTTRRSTMTLLCRKGLTIETIFNLFQGTVFNPFFTGPLHAVPLYCTFHNKSNLSYPVPYDIMSRQMRFFGLWESLLDMVSFEP
jgi:hypothetical protein